MAVGYKGKKAMATGAFYAPYIPAELTWREKIHKVYLRSVSKYGQGAWDDVISDCMDFMQRNYPGKYDTLRWINGGLEPVFKNPKHEMMWKIQYES